MEGCGTFGQMGFRLLPSSRPHCRCTCTLYTDFRFHLLCFRAAPAVGLAAGESFDPYNQVVRLYVRKILFLSREIGIWNSFDSGFGLDNFEKFPSSLGLKLVY